MTDQNRTYKNERVSTHSNVQCGSANRQTSFSGRGNARIKLPFSGRIANKFRRPTILQLNIEGLTASKMNVLHHLAMQSEAKWSHYIALTNKFAKNLLPPDSLDVDAAYQDFCNTIKKAAKKTIPRGYQNNYIPCWDAECKSLYKTFLQSPQGDDSNLAATARLATLD